MKFNLSIFLVIFLSYLRNCCLNQGRDDLFLHFLLRVLWFQHLYLGLLGFPGGSAHRESACSVGDLGSVTGLGRSPGEENDYPLQYSCLENPKDKGAWRATIHGVTKSGTRQSNQHFHFSLQISHPFRVHFCTWLVIKVQLHFSHGDTLMSQQRLLKRLVFSPFSFHGTLVKNSVPNKCKYLFLDSILFHSSTCVFYACNILFDYRSYTASFQIRKCEPSNFIIFQDCFGYSQSLEFPC